MWAASALQGAEQDSQLMQLGHIQHAAVQTSNINIVTLQFL